jgi:hypothetical protein
MADESQTVLRLGNAPICARRPRLTRPRCPDPARPRGHCRARRARTSLVAQLPASQLRRLRRVTDRAAGELRAWTVSLAHAWYLRHFSVVSRDAWAGRHFRSGSRAAHQAQVETARALATAATERAIRAENDLEAERTERRSLTDRLTVPAISARKRSTTATATRAPGGGTSRKAPRNAAPSADESSTRRSA